MTPTLVFDIETVPVVAGLRTLYGLSASTSDAPVAEIAFQQRRQASGSDFLQHHLHRVVAISCTLRDRDSFRVWTLGSTEDSEAEIIRRFFERNQWGLPLNLQMTPVGEKRSIVS